MISKYSYDFLVDTNDLQYKNFSNFTFGNHDTVFIVCSSKLLNISDITKRIDSFFKLPIQLFYGVPYPELAL